jgi:hypothetical protein
MSKEPPTSKWAGSPPGQQAPVDARHSKVQVHMMTGEHNRPPSRPPTPIRPLSPPRLMQGPSQYVLASSAQTRAPTGPRHMPRPVQAPVKWLLWSLKIEHLILRFPLLEPKHQPPATSQPTAGFNQKDEINRICRLKIKLLKKRKI